MKPHAALQPASRGLPRQRSRLASVLLGSVIPLSLAMSEEFPFHFVPEARASVIGDYDDGLYALSEDEGDEDDDDGRRGRRRRRRRRR